MTDRKLSLEERLAAHPELRARFEQILALVEDVDGQVTTADEAEERAIEQVRRLGHEMLQEWAARRSFQAAEQTLHEKPQARSNGKKNSTGTRPSDK